MNTRVLAVFAAAAATLFAVAAPSQAQSGRKPAAKKPAHARKSSRRTQGAAKSQAASDAERQAKAMKRLNDYNYVKSMSPFAGSSTKW